MRELFAKRRRALTQQVLGYLPYVFNDHFVLVLLVGLGMVLYHYRAFLQALSGWSPWLLVGLLAYSGLLLSLGRVASHLAPADQHHLLPQEAAILTHIRQSQQLAGLIWGSVQLLAWLVVAPIFLALGWGWLGFLAWALALVVLKGLLLDRQIRSWVRQGRLDWGRAIVAEQERRQSLLRFFALFTQVKGLTTSTKPRPYLNVFLPVLTGKKDRLYAQLYARALLRSGDYLGLVVRLNALSFLAVLAIDLPYLGAGLALVCQFLLVFQLLALYGHYDYQHLLRLSPVSDQDRRADLLALIQRVLYGGLFLAMAGAGSWQDLAVLILGGLALGQLYLPYKIQRH